ncbi:MAG: hypothetical protein IH621_14155 [Krumholzibacteria bacterium]|nr:hypothetical protein [Candidatus Krumholzibacteria bacterium]
MIRPRVALACVVAALAGLLAVAFGLGSDRAAVDWSAQRAVVLESDDWGLAGFVPDGGAWEGLERQALAPGRFPDVYWGSTLEDSAQVADLAAVLAGVRGRDGLPAVLQPNYIMGALDLVDGRWRESRLPDLPDRYRRDGLWPAVDAALAAGVWHPEYHGAWHYDPALRRERVATDPLSRQAAERGILLFEGSEGAWELGPWRPLPVLEAELARGIADFRRCFGRPPAAVIAPDYTWDGRIETLWVDHGLRVIQGKREQQHPRRSSGAPGRLLKVLERRWSKLTRPGLTYLERNCRFEPVQAADPAAVTAACVAQIRRAWARGEPAVVETHRVNFVHTDPAVAALGRDQLAGLLAEVAVDGPVFLTDAEVAQLGRRGVSARPLADGRTLLRNAARSRRAVAVSGTAGTGLVMLPAGAVVVLPAGSGEGPASVPAEVDLFD